MKYLIKKIKILLLFVSLCGTCYADTLVSNTIESVKVYEECALIRLKDDSRAYLFPMSAPTAPAKLSIALSAVHTFKTVEISYWGTSLCTSVDDHPNSAPAGSKLYVYSISILK